MSCYIHPANSITSRSLNAPASTTKRTNVRTLWKPYLPAAPGLMWSIPNVLSYFTFKMCECPLMKSLGGRANKLPAIDGSYRPG